MVTIFIRGVNHTNLVINFKYQAIWTILSHKKLILHLSCFCSTPTVPFLYLLFFFSRNSINSKKSLSICQSVVQCSDKEFSQKQENWRQKSISYEEMAPLGCQRHLLDHYKQVNNFEYQQKRIFDWSLTDLFLLTSGFVAFREKKHWEISSKDKRKG